MTREPIDDATIEQLVREVASGWSMPAVRLDAPSWRDRIRTPRAQRIAGAQAWLGRFGRAGSAAVALTVAGALVAVLITRPSTGPGKSTEPTGRATGPAPSGATIATPLPKNFVRGEVPAPDHVLLALGEGDFTLVDLASGRGGDAMTGGAYGSAVRSQADGTYLCLCLKLGDNQEGRPTRADISVERYAASGERLSSAPALRLVGDPDPRDGLLPERPPHVNVDLRFSADGRLGFIGWSVRKHPVWHNGITVIDVADGSTVGELDLPDDTSGDATTRRVVTAPRLLGGGADGNVVIAREWYSWSPPTSEGLNYQQDTDVFGATLAEGRLTDAAPLTGAAGCGQRVILAGTGSAGGAWLGCLRTFVNQLVLRRLDAAGSPLGDSTFTAAAGIDGDPYVLSPDGHALFAWNPVTATLARIDLVTGASTEAHGPVAALDRGPLAAFGAWLAPIAAAKSFLYGAVAISPDGSRAYAIGVDGGGEQDGVSGSSGVYAFDTSTMTSVGHWDPTADFISIAVSGDGRFVYASGLPRVDAAGRSRPAQEASVTVFDATDGSIRVIAGALGSGFLTFVDPTVR